MRTIENVNQGQESSNLGLDQLLNQPDAAEVAAPLWDMDYVLPGALIHKVTLTEIFLDQANDHLQVQVFWRLLHSSHPHPGPDIFLPSYG